MEEIAVEYSPFLRLHRETPHLTPAPQSVTYRRIPRAHRIIVVMATVYYSKTLGCKVNKGKKNAQDEIWRKQGLSFLTLGGATLALLDSASSEMCPLWVLIRHLLTKVCVTANAHHNSILPKEGIQYKPHC